MIVATVKYNDNYTDIEFPCSEAYSQPAASYQPDDPEPFRRRA